MSDNKDKKKFFGNNEEKVEQPQEASEAEKSVKKNAEVEEEMVLIVDGADKYGNPNFKKVPKSSLNK